MATQKTDAPGSRTPRWVCFGVILTQEKRCCGTIFLGIDGRPVFPRWFHADGKIGGGLCVGCSGCGWCFVVR